MFTYPKVVPQLVEDVSLKRARTEINGDDAIRVVTTNGGGTISVDAQDFADGTGLAPAQTYAGSVNHRLLTLSANSTTNTTNITSLSTTLGQPADTSASASIMGVLKGINENIPSASDLSTVDAKTTSLATAIGNTTDTSSDPTVIGILKDITSNLPTNADLTTVNTNTGSLVTSTGTINTTTSAMNTTLGTINSTQGSVSDAAWSGTGDATVISLLKGIVNKLQ